MSKYGHCASLSCVAFHQRHFHNPPKSGAVWCRWCGAHVPLGPSNDEPEAVRVEIRAAEIAADGASAGRELYRSNALDDWYGWCQHYAAVADPKFSSSVTCRESETAGWLAHEIVTHDQEQG